MLMEGLKELVEYGVIGLLLGLSVWAIGVAVERGLFFRRVDIRQFPTLDLCEVALTRRLVVIGTVAANAPYIGLLGTVLGIMLTFHTMGTSGTLAVADHDRPEPRAQGHRGGTAGRHSVRGHEQRTPASCQRTPRPVQGPAWIVSEVHPRVSLQACPPCFVASVSRRQ